MSVQGKGLLIKAIKQLHNTLIDDTKNACGLSVAEAIHIKKHLLHIVGVLQSYISLKLGAAHFTDQSQVSKVACYSINKIHTTVDMPQKWISLEKVHNGREDYTHGKWCMQRCSQKCGGICGTAGSWRDPDCM